MAQPYVAACTVRLHSAAAVAAHAAPLAAAGLALAAFAAQCVRPLLEGKGAGEGEPTSMHHSPAREVEEAVCEGKKRVHREEYVVLMLPVTCLDAGQSGW